VLAIDGQCAEAYQSRGLTYLRFHNERKYLKYLNKAL